VEIQHVGINFVSSYLFQERS